MLLKFQVLPTNVSSSNVRPGSSSSHHHQPSCCSPSSSSVSSGVSSTQRLSQLSSSDTPSCSSSAAFLVSDDQNVDRSIDELEEFILHCAVFEEQTTTDAGLGRRDASADSRIWIMQQHEVEPTTTCARFRRRPPSPSPSLPSMSAESSSNSSSTTSLNIGTRPAVMKPGPFPPIPPKPAHLMRTTVTTGGEWGVLRVYTGQIKPDTDYKTLRIPVTGTTESVVRQLVLDKLRLSLRDLNLFHLFMEVRTRRSDGTEARSILELDRTARPLELQKCHPEGMSRFILGMDSNAILARIFDSEVCPESNYKSVLISRRTSCAEVLQMLRMMCRIGERGDDGTMFGRHRRLAGDGIADNLRLQQLGLDAISELRLFVVGSRGTGTRIIPTDCALAGVYLSLLPGQRIVLRRAIVPRNECL